MYISWILALGAILGVILGWICMDGYWGEFSGGMISTCCYSNKLWIEVVSAFDLVYSCMYII